MRRPKVSRNVVYLATAFCLVTFGAGYVLAATTVSNASLSSGGNYISDTPLTWWTPSTSTPSGITTVPGPAPPAVSQLPATPTVLPTVGTSYSVGTTTAGDIAQTIKLIEGTAAPVNTELEIVFTLSTGASTITTTTVYVETQSAAPGTAQTFTFYMDAGSAASTSVTINYAIQVSQQCPSVGTCP